MRILNSDTLTSHGVECGRKAVVEILEAGLRAADPYENTRRLLRLERGKLVVGRKEFEPPGSTRTGEEVYDLSTVEHIYVLGAGKGVQRVAKAIEDALGDRLTGGHVIDKKGCDIVLQRIGVTLGAHPVPDEDCVRGCQEIFSVCKCLSKNDLVFTIAANGVSSLLTMPVPGVTLDEVRETTYIMQVERGAPTTDLNPIRNHLDQMKGGRLSAHIQPAKAVHIIAFPPLPYEYLMHQNLWLHNLPDCTTFEQAVKMLKKWKAWEDVPASVRQHLNTACPEDETVKADAFEDMSFRVFGVMPEDRGMHTAARRKAEELGLASHVLARYMVAEARDAGLTVASIAETVERLGEPFEPPCALLTGGELLVTVGKAKGIGGRNQEYALAAALRVAGSDNIVVGAVDSDGTDGPGTQFVEGTGTIPCLAGAVVDGLTVRRAEKLGVDVHQELLRHNATPVLWRLGCGVVAEQGISVGDLGVVVVLGRA